VAVVDRSRALTEAKFEIEKQKILLSNWYTNNHWQTNERRS
jgi:hypothetical protein